MDNIGEVLRFLREKHDCISGDYIAKKLKVSRTAVWKYMNQLEHFGYVIRKLKGKGYTLASTPDRLYAWEIDEHHCIQTCPCRRGGGNMRCCGITGKGEGKVRKKMVFPQGKEHLSFCYRETFNSSCRGVSHNISLITRSI